MCLGQVLHFMPVKTSLGNEWVPFYESLWSQATESLERSDRIVIIGYSMPERP
jgi:hypothetical protein